MFIEEKLESIENKLDAMTEFIKMFMPDLSKRKSVGHFLEITNNTLNAWIDEGTLKEGTHYYFDENGSMIFVPSEILQFKVMGKKRKINKSKKEEAYEVLKNMGMAS